MLKENTNQVNSFVVPPPILTVFKRWKSMSIKRGAKKAKNTKMNTFYQIMNKAVKNKSLSNKSLLPIWEFINTTIRISTASQNSLKGEEHLMEEVMLIGNFLTEKTIGLVE